MERRTQERIALQQEVLLCCHSFGMVRGKTQNISSTGVFISTGSFSIAENDAIDICFITNVENIKSMHKVSAKVARINKSGIGLSFTDELSLNVFESLN
jgi:hypothetical protein